MILSERLSPMLFKFIFYCHYNALKMKKQSILNKIHLLTKQNFKVNFFKSILPYLTLCSYGNTHNDNNFIKYQ